MLGCDVLVTALEVDSGMQVGVIFRGVGTFPDNSIVGGFSSMGVGEVVVVSTDGTGDAFTLSLVGLCLDTVGVGHFQILHISRVRGDPGGKNIYEAHTRRW